MFSVEAPGSWGSFWNYRLSRGILRTSNGLLGRRETFSYMKEVLSLKAAFRWEFQVDSSILVIGAQNEGLIRGSTSLVSHYDSWYYLIY